MIPLPLPPNSTYTSCWCEENIYLLCQNFVQNQSLRDLWDVFAIFISNSNKTVSGIHFFWIAVLTSFFDVFAKGCSMASEGCTVRGRSVGLGLSRYSSNSSSRRSWREEQRKWYELGVRFWYHSTGALSWARQVLGPLLAGCRNNAEY